MTAVVLFAVIDRGARVGRGKVEPSKHEGRGVSHHRRAYTCIDHESTGV